MYDIKMHKKKLFIKHNNVTENISIVSRKNS